MEGTYLSGKQRARLAQQGRKSHFAFGKTDGGFSTTQQVFFKSFSPSSSPQTNANNRTASHFTLGTDIRYKTSEFNSNFRSSRIEARKPQSKIKDLTPTSFVMGMQKVQFVTTNNTFVSGSPQKTQSYVNSPSKNRKHNFDLGTDSPVKSSVMHSDFSPVKPDPSIKVDRGLFNSHIVMGGHPSMYMSVATKEFHSKSEPPGNLSPQQLSELKKEHFILGKDHPSPSTNQQNSYRPFSIEKQGLNKAQLDNLKSSHFSFTAENPDYISLSNMSMRYSPAENRQQEHYLRTNHVILGDDYSKNSTCYSKNHEFRAQSVIEPVRTKVGEMNSDVVLGVTNTGFSSTSHSFLTGERAVPGRMDPQLEKNLRGHHYSLGKSTNIYEQSHKNYGKGTQPPGVFNDALRDDMTSTHWVNGFHREELSTYTQRTYQPKIAEKREIEGYLKKHNHRLGDSSGAWSSSYNGKFKWIQPVPDRASKFSFD